MPCFPIRSPWRRCPGQKRVAPPIDATPAPNRQQAAKAIKALPAGDILLVVLGAVWADSESWSSASFDDMILSSRSVFNNPASML